MFGFASCPCWPTGASSSDYEPIPTLDTDGADLRAGASSVQTSGGGVGDTPIATFPAAAPGPFADVAREQLRRPVAAAGAVHAAGETTAGETTETTTPTNDNYNNVLFSNRLSRGIGFAAYLIVLLMYGVHLSKKDGGLSGMSAIDLIGLCCVPCFASCFVSFFYHLFFGY